MSADLTEKLVFFGCVIVAIILHEISHGVVALWFGDDTAKRGRPAHAQPDPAHRPVRLDHPAGVRCARRASGAFGWAKPVPVDPRSCATRASTWSWVGLVGPFTNFALMAIAAVAARMAYSIYTGFADRVADLPLFIQVLLFFALANLFLGVFNLLPIPPLDGSSLIERILPDDWLPNWYKFRPYGMLVILLLAFSTNILGTLFDPFIDALFDFITGG